MKALRQFEHTVDGLYGHYLDSLKGFEKVREEAIKGKENLWEMFYGEAPTEEELATVGSQFKYCYSTGLPDSDDFVELHSVGYDQYIARNSPTGMNPWFAGTTFVVHVYAFWEHFHRANIAKDLGCRADEVIAPIMGDLRHYRQSILHYNGRATKAVGTCEVLKWHKPGDALSLDEKKIEEIVAAIKRWIRETARRSAD